MQEQDVRLVMLGYEDTNANKVRYITTVDRGEVACALSASLLSLPKHSCMNRTLCPQWGPAGRGAAGGAPGAARERGSLRRHLRLA